MKIIFSVPLQSLLKAYGNIIIDNWLLYHKWDVVWSCLCRIDGRFACCLIYCDESRRHKDRQRHAFFFNHMPFSSYVILRKKYFPLKCSSCFSSANFVPLPKKQTVQFDLTKMQNAVFDFIRLLQSSDSVLNSILLHWNFFRFSSIILQELNWLIVILDKNESTIFNKVNFVFLPNV